MEIVDSINDEIRNILTLLDCCDPWLVGGVPRNILLGIERFRDIDIVVDNNKYDFAIDLAISEIGRAEINRHNNKRITTKYGTVIDIWCPARFFSGFNDVRSMLQNVDYTCNSLAISLKYPAVIESNSLIDINQKILRPNIQRWKTQSSTEYSHLIGRGVNFVKKYNFVPEKSNFFKVAIDSLDENVLLQRYSVTSEMASKYLLL